MIPMFMCVSLQLYILAILSMAAFVR